MSVMQIEPTPELIALEGRPPLQVRVYQAQVARPAPLVLHMPGGAFLGLPEARPVAELLAEAGAVVVSADYPAGPGHPFPEAAETLYAALGVLHQRRAHWASRGSQLFVAGEEAGGNLAAALALMARDRLGPPIAGQILLSPMLDAGMATCSYRDAEAGTAGCHWAEGWTTYLGTAACAAHPYAVPACGTRLNRLPPMLAITAPHDLMRDECIAYAARLRQAGVDLHMRALAGDGWPEALMQPWPPGLRPGWADGIRNAAAHFFSAVTPDLVPAPSFAGSPA